MTFIIFECLGAWYDGRTLFVNGSTCQFNYKPINKPIVVHLPYDRLLPPILVHDDEFSLAV